MAVFDTSPLILLDRLGYLPALRELRGSIVIPEAVAQELVRQPGKPASNVPDFDWVITRRAPVDALGLVLGGPPAIDSGEAEAIALALVGRVTLVIDESKGRERARRLDISLSGTIGELLLLRGLGLTGAYSRRSPEEDIDMLVDAGMRLSDELRARVLHDLRNVR